MTNCIPTRIPSTAFLVRASSVAQLMLLSLSISILSAANQTGNNAVAALQLTSTTGSSVRSPESDREAEDELVPDKEIQELLDSQDLQDKVPGMIAAIAEEGKPLRIAAIGLVRNSRDLPLRLDHRMHLGSCTKAMTSTLAGILIDEGKLSFEDTIEKRLPELALKIHEDYRQVTLYQCLTHTSGMPANAKNWWMNYQDADMDMQTKRQLVAMDTLADAPENPPGSKYLYSNLGYLIAGMMIEKVTHSDWETAIGEKLFRPLGITTYGFGIPGRTGSNQQPWGHRFNDKKSMVPIQKDNAPALGPAGTSNMTVADWSRFVLMAEQGYRISQNPDAKDCDLARGLISNETWKVLFTAPEIDGKSTYYACGWFLAGRPWAKGVAINHTGSNTSWFCTVWASPKLKKAFMVAVNIAGEDTDQLVDQMISKLIQLDREGGKPK